MIKPLAEAPGLSICPSAFVVTIAKSFVNHFISNVILLMISLNRFKFGPGCIAQSVTCLAKDANLTADPGVMSLIPAQSHTFVEIDHEIISMVILLPSAESFMKGCYQLQAKVCARITKLTACSSLPRKKCG